MTETLTRPLARELSWGRHYLAVDPTHFRVDYAINPYMDLADQPDPAPHPGAVAGARRRARAAGARSRSSTSAPTPPTWSTR